MTNAKCKINNAKSRFEQTLFAFLILHFALVSRCTTLYVLLNYRFAPIDVTLDVAVDVATGR